jgi:nucleotide-binding universal stress UspA family protein
MTASPFIVVGCDGSLESDPALRFAAQEADLRHARLVVVTAYARPIDPDLDNFDISDSELHATARSSAETALHRALGASSADLGCHIVCAEGEPAQVLVDHSTNAIMIIIGSHDRPLLQRLFTRSTSRGLLHGSSVPVTIVPAPHQ